MAAGATKLAPVVQQLQADYPAAKIAVWDVLGAVEEITLSDPPAFGFSDNTEACLGGSPGRRRAARRLLSAAQRRALAAAADGVIADGAAAAEEAAAFLADEEPIDGIITQSHCSDVDQYTYWVSCGSWLPELPCSVGVWEARRGTDALTMLCCQCAPASACSNTCAPDPPVPPRPCRTRRTPPQPPNSTWPAALPTFW